MTTPEGKLKQQVDKYLRALPNCYVFAPVQAGYGKRTIDRLCCINGRFVGIELKAPGEVPTKLQENIMRDIRVAGGVAFWCADFEMFLELMRLYMLLHPSDLQFKRMTVRWRPIQNGWNLKCAPWSGALGIEEDDDSGAAPAIVCWFTRGWDNTEAMVAEICRLHNEKTT